jgi:hypothetical protein
VAKPIGAARTYGSRDRPRRGRIRKARRRRGGRRKKEKRENGMRRRRHRRPRPASGRPAARHYFRHYSRPRPSYWPRIRRKRTKSDTSTYESPKHGGWTGSGEPSLRRHGPIWGPNWESWYNAIPLKRFIDNILRTKKL